MNSFHLHRYKRQKLRRAKARGWRSIKYDLRFSYWKLQQQQSDGEKLKLKSFFNHPKTCLQLSNECEVKSFFGESQNERLMTWNKWNNNLAKSHTGYKLDCWQKPRVSLTLGANDGLTRLIPLLTCNLIFPHEIWTCRKFKWMWKTWKIPLVWLHYLFVPHTMARNIPSKKLRSVRRKGNNGIFRIFSQTEDIKIGIDHVQEIFDCLLLELPFDIHIRNPRTNSSTFFRNQILTSYMTSRLRGIHPHFRRVSTCLGNLYEIEKCVSWMTRRIARARRAA